MSTISSIKPAEGSMKLRHVVALMLVLSACAPVQTAPVVSTDKFSKNITVTGITAESIGGTFVMPDDAKWNLRSWVGKQSGVTTTQLYVSNQYSASSWKFFDVAADQDSTSLAFSQISRDVLTCQGGCKYDEEFGADIPQAALEKYAATGYQVKFSAHDGSSLVVTVTPQQISQQLAAIAAAAPQAPAVPTPPVAPVATPGAGGSPAPARLHLGVHFVMNTPSAQVSAVEPGSPAEAAGLQPGDLIVGVNGQNVGNKLDIPRLLAPLAPGTSAPITVMRGGQPVQLNAVMQ